MFKIQRKLFTCLVLLALLLYSESNVYAAATKVQKASPVSRFTFKKTKLPSTTEKEKYIIITKDKQKADTILGKYKSAKHSKFSRLAKGKNIISVKMTGKEANEILKDTDVLCVEPDGNVTGCTEETTPGHITEENQKTWNQEMLHIPGEKEEGAAKIKVAVLDSGIDYGNDIVYKEQINLIPGEEELTPFFTDATGHGTSVASICHQFPLGN